jgi:hypothetical protein
MSIDRDLLNILNSARVCLWFGLPPCPLCGGDHGDPKCSPSKDAAERAAVDADQRRRQKP